MASSGVLGTTREGGREGKEEGEMGGRKSRGGLGWKERKRPERASYKRKVKRRDGRNRRVGEGQAWRKGERWKKREGIV